MKQIFKNIKKQLNSLRFKILLRILIVLISGNLLLSFILYLSFKKNLEIYSKEVTSKNETLFNALIKSHTQKLFSIIETVSENEEIKKRFLEKNRDSLYKYALPLFNKLTGKHSISHWYFHNPPPEKTCFLRVHAPEKFGDINTRSTYLRAVELQSIAHGLEFGTRFFALRAVQPYYNGEEIIGYLELSEDFPVILDAIKTAANNHYFLFVRKELVGEDDWKRHLSLIQKRNNWNDYEKLVVVNETTDDRFNNDILHDIDVTTLTQKTKIIGITHENNITYLNAVHPVTDFKNSVIGGLLVMYDITELYVQMNNFKILSTVALSAMVILSLLYLLFSMTSLRNSIVKITKEIDKISDGELELSHKIGKLRNDEIGDIQIHVNKLSNRMQQIAYYAQQIGKGNLDVEIKHMGTNDIISQSIDEMKENLQKSKIAEEHRKKIEKTEAWIRNGVSEFNDILRQNYSSINELGFVIISKMVDYLNINQAGLFVLNDNNSDDIYLDLVATYAYDRQKFVKRKVKLGDGLVGGVAMEKKRIYIDELPDDYIKIESGLGDANPNFLLINPLLNEDNILGVIELASFRPIEEHELEFIEKVGINIAISLSNTKAALQTSYLLEQLKHTSDEQSSQEEELRQNLEELEATQDNSRKLKEEADMREQIFLMQIKELQDEIMYLKSLNE